MDTSGPPDMTARVAELERQVKDLQRNNDGAPTLFSLSDVSGQPAFSGMVMGYDRDSGEWRPEALIEPGDIRWSCSNQSPLGRWLEADGSAVSRTTYALLFQYIGTAYGSGDGSTTFNLPNLSGRFPLAVDGSHALGSTGGSANATTVTHSHHTGLTATNAEASGLGLTVTTTFEDRVRVNRATGVGTGDVSDATGSSGTNANMPPYIALWAYVRY